MGGGGGGEVKFLESDFYFSFLGSALFFFGKMGGEGASVDLPLAKKH